MNFEDNLVHFESELNEIARRKVEEFFSKTSRQICKNFKSSTRSLYVDCFSACFVDFWSEVEDSFMVKIAEALDDFDKKCTVFAGDQFFFLSKTDLENELVSIYREILQTETGKSTMNLRFTKIADKNFRFDSSGRPRHWENLVMIDEAYDMAIIKVFRHSNLMMC